MKRIFHSHANKTHFHKKGCTLGLILKVSVFGTREWPIRYLINEKGTGADRNAPVIVSGIITGNAPVSHSPNRVPRAFPSIHGKSPGDEVAIRQFFLLPCNSPRSLFENRLDPVSFSFLKCRIRHFYISHNTLCSCPPTHANSFAYALFTFLSGRLKVPKEDDDNAYTKLFACVLEGKKHANNVYYGKCGTGA